MAAETSKFENALILVVDDEDTQRLLTRDYLEDERFRVIEANNGEDGLRLLRERKPDLLILDVMMPGIDGFEVCRKLRLDPTVSDTPVIIVTGMENVEDINRGFAAGATDFLTKPVVWNLLASRIRYVLRTNRLEKEIRFAKEVAERASEAKSTLLATMGHELRTPLNAIIGFSELIQEKVHGPIGIPEYEEYVLDIHTSGKRLLDAIDAILEIVNCESGNLRLDQEEICVSDLVASVVERLGPESEALGVGIVNNVSDGQVRLNGDAQRLQSTLLHIVANALKFTDQGGLVRLEQALLETGELILSIVDNGIGIAASDLKRIQEPFVQADSSLARKFEGLGLGIPLARAIVRLHNGDLAYDSALGHGTTVRITLPGAWTIPVQKIPAARAS